MPILEVLEYEIDTLSDEQPIKWKIKKLREAKIEFNEIHIDTITNFIEEENENASKTGTEKYLAQNGNSVNGLLTLVNYTIIANDTEGTTLKPFQQAKDTISKLLMELEYGK